MTFGELPLVLARTVHHVVGAVGNVVVLVLVVFGRVRAEDFEDVRANVLLGNANSLVVVLDRLRVEGLHFLDSPLEPGNSTVDLLQREFFDLKWGGLALATGGSHRLSSH